MSDPNLADTTAVTYTDLPDLLAFWHPVDDAEIDDGYLDWGDVAATSSADRQVRVKNCSTDAWAFGIVVQAADPQTGPQPLVKLAGQHWLSMDGNTFTPSIDIGDLPPTGVSQAFTLRRVTDPGADAGEGRFLLTAIAQDWG